MTTARQRILDRLAAGLARPHEPLRHASGVSARRSNIEKYLKAGGKPSVSSTVTQNPGRSLVTRLGDLLNRQSARVIEVDAAVHIPSRLANELPAPDQSTEIAFGSDPVLNEIPWSDHKNFKISHGKANKTTPVGVSRAVAGIAEIGGLVLLSGPQNPVTLAFLPGCHVVVLPRQSVVGTYEEAIDCVRRSLPDGELPRTVNIITGPSRTADIGGKPTIGAHGPYRLIVFILDRVV